MNKPVTALVTAIGVALIVTAFGLHPEVSKSIAATASGGKQLEQGALGL